jgi:flavin reductase (DIM6/NTAB) family NADH-FMN oxidoreductase RutF
MDLESVSLGMNKRHYTNAGIKANKTFSINIPSAAMVKETDYYDLVSGKMRRKQTCSKRSMENSKPPP